MVLDLEQERDLCCSLLMNLDIPASCLCATAFHGALTVTLIVLDGVRTMFFQPLSVVASSDFWDASFPCSRSSCWGKRERWEKTVIMK